MDLICYLHRGWQPLIRPASAKRDWMDAMPEAFAYRCLPLNIANGHGWELLNPHAFDACWNGRGDTAAISIRVHGDGPREQVATSLFGQGVLTFHVPGIIRTPPGWNLWVSGPPNEPKDGIAPLTGVVETDWSPFTFTMNWRFTRSNHWIHFAAGEPICFFFPVQRALLDGVRPAYAPIEAEPDLAKRFGAWSEQRDAFVLKMADMQEAAPSSKWQKHYYRGVDISEAPGAGDHQIKHRLRDFDASAIDWALPDLPEARPAAAATPAPDLAPDNSASPQAARDLRKRDWLLDTVEGLRSLSPIGAIIERRSGLGADEFLDRYYATNRPVILTGEMADWPALAKWTPDYLKRTVGARPVEFQGGRSRNADFETQKDAHRRELPFDRFIDLITQPGAGNDAYLTAYNSARNVEALAPLGSDLGFPDEFLSREAPQPDGMMWIGPAGTLTPLHHDLTNNLIAQVVGRKKLLVLPASEVGKLYNHLHVFSRIGDLEDPALSLADFPLLQNVRMTEVTLMPGEMIFMPLAWWHQVRAIDFSVTITYTSFRWPNDGYRTYPAG